MVPCGACAGFYVVFHFFGLPSSAGLPDLERKGRQHCGQEWGVLEAARGAELHMDQYCFRCIFCCALAVTVRGNCMPHIRGSTAPGSDLCAWKDDRQCHTGHQKALLA